MFVRAVRGAPTKRPRRNSAQPGVRGPLPAGRVDGAFVCLLGGAGGGVGSGLRPRWLITDLGW